MGRDLRLTSSDGHEFDAYLAEAEDAPRGAIVVCMEMYGVNNYVRWICNAYAEEGYTAIAPCLFDRLEPGLTLPYNEVGSARGKELSAKIDYSETILDIKAAAAQVRTSGRTAITGYCFGGTVTWLAACRTNFDAAIVFYGSNMCDFPDDVARCPIISHVGELDTAVPQNHVAAFQRKRPEVLWYVYSGAPHGFDNWTRPARYREAAATLARVRTLEFLEQHIG